MVNYEPVEQGSKTIEYDISNLIFVDSDSDKAGKIGFSYLDDGSKVRVVKNRRS